MIKIAILGNDGVGVSSFCRRTPKGAQDMEWAGQKHKCLILPHGDYNQNRSYNWNINGVSYVLIDTSFIYSDFDNIDLIVIMTNLRDSISSVPKLYKRVANIPVVIALNHADLYSSEERNLAVRNVQENVPSTVHIKVISTRTGEGCDSILLFPRAKKIILEWWKRKRHILKPKIKARLFRDVHTELEYKPGVGVKFFEFENYIDGLCRSTK